MKLFLMSLALAWIPQWLSTTVARTCDEVSVVKDPVVIIADGEMTIGDDNCVVATAGEGGNVVAYGVASAGRGDGRSEPKVVKIKKVKEKSGGKGRGWLGVSIGEVPKAVAAQLETEGRGVIILNVVEDSPADRAGLEAHDIIFSVEGDVVIGATGQAVDLIKSREPDETVDIKVLRGGREKTLTVTLGSRAELKGPGFRWKFKGAPDAEIEEKVRTHGRILRKLGDKKWILEDLGDLEELKDLPKHIRMSIPKSGSRSVQISIDDSRKKIKTKVERDGSVIVVEQEDDGEITVTRVDEDGKETEATYGDADELREADEEAYELYEELSESAVIHLDMDAIEIPDIEIPEIELDLDADEWKEHVEEWRGELEESLTEVQETYKEAMEELQEAMEEWKRGEGLPPLGILPQLLRHKEGGPPFAGFMGRHLGKPRHTFEVQADGTIEVRIRKGDSELVQLFQDEDDLARRSPKLFEKYEKLISQEDEE